MFQLQIYSYSEFNISVDTLQLASHVQSVISVKGYAMDVVIWSSVACTWTVIANVSSGVCAWMNMFCFEKVQGDRNASVGKLSAK